MASEQEVGRVVNTVAFKIDSTSWKNLNAFQRKMSEIKAQMKGLTGNIKIGLKDKSDAIKKVKETKEKARGPSKKRLTDARKLEANRDKLIRDFQLRDKKRAEKFQEALSAEKLRDVKKVSKAEKKQAATRTMAQKLEANRDGLLRQFQYKDLQKQRKLQDALSAEKLRDTKKRIKEEESLRLASEKKLKQAKAAVQSRQTRSVGFTSGMNKLNPSQLAVYQKKVNSLDKSLIAGAFSVRQYQDRVSNLNTEFRQLNRRTKSVNKHFKDLRSTMIAGGLAYAAFEGVMGLEQTGQQFDSIESTMFAATGSIEKTAQEMKYLDKVTTRFGINTLQTGKNYAKMLASADGTEVKKGDITDVFEGLLTAAAATGSTTDEIKGATKAIVQIISKGQVMAEELKSQLGEHLIKTLPLAAKAAGFVGKDAVAQFLEAMEKGLIKPEKFIGKFGIALKENFGDAAEKAANKNRAAMTRVTNAWDKFQNTIHKAGFGRAMKEVYHFLEDFLVAATPLASFLTGVFSQAFIIATLPIRLLVAAVADLVDYLGMDSSFIRFDGNIMKLTQTIVGTIAGFVLFRKSLTLTKWALRSVSSALNAAGEAHGALGKRKPVKLKATFGGVGGALGASALGYTIGTEIGTWLYDTVKSKNWFTEIADYLFSKLDALINIIKNPTGVLGDIAQEKRKEWGVDEKYEKAKNWLTSPWFGGDDETETPVPKTTLATESLRGGYANYANKLAPRPITLSVKSDGTMLAESIKVTIDEKQEEKDEEMDQNLQGNF